MKTTAKHPKLILLSAAVAALALVVPTPALADPLPYGPDTCIQGYVWREARTGDTVCVTPEVRTRTAQENANPSLNKEPTGGAYGPNTCKSGFVWREAFDGDTICVTPEIRAQTLADNAAAASRKQANQPQTPPANSPVTTPPATPGGSSTVKFEVTGSGKAITIDIDPSADRFYDQQLPWSTTITVGPDVQLLQVVAVGGDNAGCRITVDGVVVTTQPAGSAHCSYKRF